MKKILLASAFSLSVSGVFAQAIDALAKVKEETCKSLMSDLAKAEKNTADPKKGLKSSTWVKLAEVYTDMSSNQCPADSMSSMKAYYTYKKADSLDKAAGGKSAKEIGEALSGQKMYTVLMLQGVAFYNTKNLPKAVKLFALASKVNPKDSTSALYEGIAAQSTKDFSSAKEGFSHFVELGGKDPAVFYSLARMYKDEKNIDKAVEILKKGIALNPNDKDLKNEVINTHLAGGHTEDAIADLKKSAEADPKNVQTLLNLGILLDNSGKKDEALVWYKKVMDIDPNNYDCNYNLGVFYFNQAVELKKEVDKMDMKAYKERGKDIEEKVCAKFTESKPYFERCKAVKPNETEINDNLTNLQGALDQCGKKK